MNTHILTIHCPDERGLIYKITNVIFNYNLNIIRNDEFVEKDFNQFFMRTEFSGEFQNDAFINELTSILPATSKIKLTSNHKKNIVVMATKEYHCLSDLLVRHKFNDLHANIVAVISNHSVLEELTSKFDIPYYNVDSTGRSREDHEEDIIKLLDKFNPDFIVLAKYMKILSPSFIARYPNRIINIHHSFLPAFVGAKPYHKAYERGVKIIGATAHFVNEDLDEGPIIAQSVIAVDHTDSASEMAQAGRDVEKSVLANSLKLVFNEQVFVFRNKTIIFD
ncbi:formyltetrahydrofolate deformylase [Segetibacter koreensis]|uniref:formyltetrahydrofolate deformylase n=1 Tax=Segetibacter koreensis TaxID=398037 RepID=UPI000367514D|nr:formyltetrahydrofolate deformylase [Segetibacter koreensis]